MILPITKDDSTYDTVFQSISGDTLILRVHWPSSAMVHAQPPAMTLAGVEAQHPWLDRRMRVTGYEPIQTPENWRDSNVLLGAAVHTVIKYLQLNPPTIVQFVDQGLISIQTKSPPSDSVSMTNGSGHHNSNNRKINSQQDSPPPAYNSMLASQSAKSSPPLLDVDLPKIPTHFPGLDNLPRDQLERLASDNLEFKAFCNKIPLTSEYHDVQRKLLAENAAVASRNLESQVELQDLYDACISLQTELQIKVKRFKELEQKQDAICKPPPIHTVTKELIKAKKAAFEDSERIAEGWLESDDCATVMDDFVKAFLESRQIHHMRGAKLEMIEHDNTSQFGGR